LNSITIVGRIGKDATLKTVNDKDVAEFSLAMDTQVKGEKVTLWFDCAVWGARAKNAAQYLKKGGTIGVTGRLQPPYVKDEKAYLKVDVNDFTLPPKSESAAPPPPAAKDEIPF
jgi:single-strand DNA-binding protein